MAKLHSYHFSKDHPDNETKIHDPEKLSLLELSLNTLAPYIFKQIPVDEEYRILSNTQHKHIISHICMQVATVGQEYLHTYGVYLGTAVTYVRVHTYIRSHSIVI